MADKGKNRAAYKEDTVEYLLASSSDRKCIFISHKKEDEEAAKAIGDYIMDHGFDIYLDLYDCDLQEAVSIDNDRLIVKSIKKGLKASTHLLCLVSDKTKLSWWVPYEVGVAGENGAEIASLKLKKVEDIPSFLKTEKVLHNQREFYEYISSKSPFGGLLEKEFSHDDQVALGSYID